MVVACSTSAFNVPLSDALSSVAELGFSNVDLIASPGWQHLSPERAAQAPAKEAAQTKTLLQKYLLKPIALNMAVGNLHQRNDEVNAKRLAQVTGIAKVMRELKIRKASFYPGYKDESRPWKNVFEDTVETIWEFIKVSRRDKVDFIVEPHFDTPFQTIEQAFELLAAIPDLWIAFDPSHFAMQGIDIRRMETFLYRTAHVHLRDAAPGKMQEAFGKGTVRVGWLLDALKAHRYEGTVSIEYLPTKDFDVRDNILRALELVNKKLG